MPALYQALGIYLPLITTNCAVLGVVLLNTQYNYNFIESLIYGITGGVGFLVAIVLFASIREHLVFAEYPKSFEGFPIALVTAGLLALSFMDHRRGFLGGNELVFHCLSPNPKLFLDQAALVKLGHKEGGDVVGILAGAEARVVA